jgi:hypothetical protein
LRRFLYSPKQAAANKVNGKISFYMQGIRGLRFRELYREEKYFLKIPESKRKIALSKTERKNI